MQHIKKTLQWALPTLLLLLTSCIDGYKNDWTFTTGITGQTLQSPPADQFTFAKNAEGTILTITWPVVYGAGGYQFSLYDATDPNNPLPLIQDEIIDGCLKRCPLAEDTNYKITVKALGSQKLNNQEAPTPTEVTYSTMLPAVIIPNGTDLYAYFQTNPIPPSAEEQAYELEAGGNYTLSGSLDFGNNLITLRGNKANYPTLKYTSDGRLSLSNGFKLKFMHVDCSNVTATTGAINLSLVPDEAILTGGYYTLPNPLVLQSCTFKGVNSYFLWDNNKAYCVPNFLMQDCIVDYSSTGVFFRMTNNSYINSLIIQNSTIYGKSDSGGYFIQYKNNARGTGTIVNFANNTFYNLAVTGQMANYSGLNNSGCRLVLYNNIFTNCGSKDVVRRLSAGGTNIQKDLRFNCYWYDIDNDGTHEFEAGNEMGHAQGDKSGTGFYENPTYNLATLQGDPQTINFTPGPAATQILLNRCGDPRWLPQQ
jgi:hypothetical protein